MESRGVLRTDKLRIHRMQSQGYTRKQIVCFAAGSKKNKKWTSPVLIYAVLQNIGYLSKTLAATPRKHLQTPKVRLGGPPWRAQKKLTDCSRFVSTGLNLIDLFRGRKTQLTCYQSTNREYEVFLVLSQTASRVRLTQQTCRGCSYI